MKNLYISSTLSNHTKKERKENLYMKKTLKKYIIPADGPRKKTQTTTAATTTTKKNIFLVCQVFI